MGALFFLSFYLQLVRGYTPLQAGLLMVPFAVGAADLRAAQRGMVKRFGAKAVCAVGMALVARRPGRLRAVGATTPIWIARRAVLRQGVGMANVMPPATESIMSSLPREKAGVGSAVSNTVRQVGGALGRRDPRLGPVGGLPQRHGQHRGGAAAQAPASARGAITESVAGAYAVAENPGTPFAGFAPVLIKAADAAFVNAIHSAAIGSAIVGLIGLLVVLRLAAGQGQAAAAHRTGRRRGGADDDSERAVEAVEVG